MCPESGARARPVPRCLLAALGRDRGSWASVLPTDCSRGQPTPPRGAQPVSLGHQRLNARFLLAPSVRRNRKINPVYKRDGT